MNLLKGWLGIGKDQPKEKKPGTVFAPLMGRQEASKANGFRPGGGMDANVVPSPGLEWMDEKEQK